MIGFIIAIVAALLVLKSALRGEVKRVERDVAKAVFHPREQQQARPLPDHSPVLDQAMSINSQRPEMQSLEYGHGFQDAHRPGLLHHGAMRVGDRSGIWHVNY